MSDWKFGDVLRRESGRTEFHVVFFLTYNHEHKDGWFNALILDHSFHGEPSKVIGEIQAFDPVFFGSWQVVEDG